MSDAAAVFAGALVFALGWAWTVRQPKECAACRVLFPAKCRRHK